MVLMEPLVPRVINAAGGGFDIRAIAHGRFVPVLDLFPAVRPAAADKDISSRPAHPLVMKHKLRLVSRLLAALALLQILDMASTLLLLSIGGMEANPVSAWLLQRGVGAFVLAKLAIAAAALTVIPFLEKDRRKVGAGTTWTCVGFDVIYGITVVSNLIQFALFA